MRPLMIMLKPPSLSRVFPLALLVSLMLLPWLVAPVAARTSLDVLAISPQTTAELDIAGVSTFVRPSRAVDIQNGGHALAPDMGIPSTVNLTAFHRDDAGNVYFAVSGPTVLGGNTYTPDQVVRWDGGSYAVHFDGASAGVPAGIHVTAFSMAPGRDLISFDTAFTAGTLSSVPADLLAWDGVQFSREFDSLSEGISFGNLDAASYLPKIERLLLSFNVGGWLGGIAYDHEDVLEFVPGTSAWDLSVDASDLDLDWETGGLDAVYAEEGFGDVNTAEYATLRMLDVSPAGSPATFELRLDCGGHRVTEISTAVVLHPNVSASNVTIGDCTTGGCGGVSGFGSTVNASAVTASFPPGTPPERPDSVYLTFPASGSEICNPNEDVLLADVSISGFAGTLPTPLLTQEGAAASLRDGGTLEKDMIAMTWGPGGAADRLIFRAPIGDTSGLKQEVILVSPTRYHILGFAVLPPVGAANVFFGGCITTGGVFYERSCLGATDLGPTVDDANSYTQGPDPVLTTFGGYGNALYVTLQGTLVTPGLPALNRAGKPTLLGIITYVPTSGGTLTQGMPATQGLGSGDLALTNSIDTQSQQTNGIGEGELDPGLGGDVDGDDQADDWDNCPTIPNEFQEDVGGVDSDENPDGTSADEIGDACQCGDVSTDATDPAGKGIVNAVDVQLIRDALAEKDTLDPQIALRCNVNGAQNQLEGMGGLPEDCEISDAMALLRIFDGLDAPGDNLQQCVAP